MLGGITSRQDKLEGRDNQRGKAEKSGQRQDDMISRPELQGPGINLELIMAGDPSKHPDPHDQNRVGRRLQADPCFPEDDISRMPKDDPGGESAGENGEPQKNPPRAPLL